MVLVLGLMIRHFFIWRPLDPSVLYRKGFLLFGHRGASKFEPENTLPAFRKAVSDGCNAIELDVHRTRDGHLVILHDATLERTTSDVGRLSDRRLAELKSINAAVQWEGRREEIPTLLEVIQALPDDLVFNIEIKNFSFFSEQRIELEVVRFIHEHGIRDRCIVSSFNPLNIWRIKMADPTIFTAQLWFEPSIFNLRNPQWVHVPQPHTDLPPEDSMTRDVRFWSWLRAIPIHLGIHLTHPDIFHPHEEYVTRGVRFWARMKSIPMHVWVVNDADRMRSFASDRMIRGIMTDDTVLLAATLREKV